MNDTDHDMLIRHDQQLLALRDLSDAITTLADKVQSLKTQLAIANARTIAVAGCIGTMCSVIATVGTWMVMIHVGK